MKSQISGAPRTIYHFILSQPILVLLIVLMIVIQSQADGFLTVGNLRGIAMDSAILAIVAIPSALLIIGGYFDLSVGSTLGLGAVVSGTIMATTQVPAPIAILAGVAAGAAVGLIVGLITTYGRLSAFIVTLGALTAVRGLAMLISPLPTAGYGDDFAFLGTGAILGIPVPVLIAGTVILIGGLFLGYTPAGRHVFAIGVNAEAARLSGLAVRRLPFILYILTGAAAGLGGAITASRLDSAPAGSVGVGFELVVLTAVLLGGVTFTGGSGSIFGVVIGVLFLGVLNNGLTLLGVTQSWQQIASGCALVLAIALSMIPKPAKKLETHTSDSPSRHNTGAKKTTSNDDGHSVTPVELEAK